MHIKICGLTRPEDALLAYELGAWALGFIFYPRSPRFISPKNVASIVAALPESSQTVGVFVNEPLESLIQAVRMSGISAIQLHGDESPRDVRKIKKALNDTISRPVKTFKALRLKTASDLNAFEDYTFCDGLVVESGETESYGGSGIPGNWQLASSLTEKLKQNAAPIILAGGLKPDNVAEAIKTVRPFAVDGGSGVESAKGIKSPQLLQYFFENAKGS